MAYALHRAERSPVEGVNPVLLQEASDAGAPFRSDVVLFASSTLGVTLRSVGNMPAHEWRPLVVMGQDDLLFAAEVRMAPYISAMCTAKIYVRALPLSGSAWDMYGTHQLLGNEVFRVETDNPTLCGLELTQEVGEGVKILYVPTEDRGVPESASGSPRPICPAYRFFFGQQSLLEGAETGRDVPVIGPFYACLPADIRFQLIQGSASRGVVLRRDLAEAAEEALRFEGVLDLNTGIGMDFMEYGTFLQSVSPDRRYVAVLSETSVGNLRTHAIRVVDLLTGGTLTSGSNGLAYLPAGWVLAGDEGAPLDNGFMEFHPDVVKWNPNRRIEVSITRASATDVAGAAPSTRSYFIAY